MPKLNKCIYRQTLFGFVRTFKEHGQWITHVSSREWKRCLLKSPENGDVVYPQQKCKGWNCGDYKESEICAECESTSVKYVLDGRQIQCNDCKEMWADSSERTDRIMKALEHIRELKKVTKDYKLDKIMAIKTPAGELLSEMWEKVKDDGERKIMMELAETLKKMLKLFGVEIGE